MPEPNPARRDRLRILLPGEPPSPAAIIASCRFRQRCALARPICAVDDPPLLPPPDGEGERVACHVVQGRR